MYKALISAIAIMFAVSTEPVAAKDISLICKLRSGNQVPLVISGNDVLNDGHSIKNLDQNSLTVGTGHIAFKQAFGSYDNAWRINRNNLQFTFKTILKPDSRVVLEEKGSCANAETASRIPQRKPATPAGLSATIAAMLPR